MRIPNLNTLGTYIERLIIENVKRVHFETMLEDGGDKAALQPKIDNQIEVSHAIETEAILALTKVLTEAKYNYFGEGRSLA